MSIKKLFGADTSRNYLGDITEQEAFENAESVRNVNALKLKQDTFVPQIDYTDPKNFAKYGSAYLYYKSAIERIIDFYPYDGSDAEINQFYNNSLDIEKYIFNNLYPRTNGHIIMSSDEWGTLSGSLQSGYGLPSSLEYIDLKGGPHTIYDGNKTTPQLFRDPYSSKLQFSNLYETDLYVSASLPAGYGSGSRESNLKADFDKGVTIEFWTKTGSIDLSLTNKQVLVDVWNNELSSSAYAGAAGTNPNPHYGRITVMFNGLSAGSPFRLTAQSGATGIFEQSIGTDITVDTFDDWKHYALVMYNTGSDFITKLYVDGRINDINTATSTTVNEINSKNMTGRLGALLTAPSGAGGNSQEVENMIGAGKLSGSVDEFRYWKVMRTGKQIGKDWFTQVRGGTNTDIANTTLGVYYKFNEGISGDSTTDSSVLDYSGRLSNGTWTGYESAARSTGSAIIEASASTQEYRDPIIYSTNSEVSTLKENLLASGSYHDANNNAAFKDLIPSWVLEDDELSETNNINIVTHIMGAYFDKIHAYISALPTFKNTLYTSGAYTPLPFAEHLPQSLGLYSPELFIDADVMEKFLNRDDTTLFQGDLTETKNLIYLNLYNNIANIYKAKGTQKAVRNILRCFHAGEELVKLNAYSDNNIYTLSNNLQQTTVNKNYLNLNNANNLQSVVYQAQDPSNGESRGYISGSEDAATNENPYGLTLEADVQFPSYVLGPDDPVDRQPLTISLFGMYSASVDDESDPTFFASDKTNFQIFAVRSERESADVYFKLTSSLAPFPLPELTSSVFFNVYDNQQWNFSVRIKPKNFPLADMVSGSSPASYDVIFKGINTELGYVKESFYLTSSIVVSEASSLLKGAKRVFGGAHRTNMTGTLLAPSDVRIGGIRYWGKYLDDISLEQHLFDVNNIGISSSYQHISPLDSNNVGYDILNSNMLFLDWNFGNVTSSDSSGNFYVTDYSSGSTLIRNNYGWVGDIAGYQYSGYGYGFSGSATNVVDKTPINTFKFIDPEMVVASDMIQILSDDDVVFGSDLANSPNSIPSYRYVLEKSQYAAISQEMLQFFAGVVDFNNIVGEPVNRYRDRYKTMEKLRETFFRRVTDVQQVEKFITYYKWFDDALAEIIGQLLPASADFNPDIFNTVESHVLERNKYKSQFPTIEFEEPDLNAALEGVFASSYPYVEGSTPLPSSPRSTEIKRWYWDHRALRQADEITSRNSTVDEQRNIVRDVVYNNPHLSQSISFISGSGGIAESTARSFAVNRLAKTFLLKAYSPFSTGALSLKGGTNFTNNKNINFTYNALYPAGPVNTENNVYVPENILVGFTDEMEGYHETTDLNDVNAKYKRYLPVNHGRNWQNGYGYANVKSSYVFPFNIISPAVSSGFNKQVIDRVTGNIQITNLHHDGYGTFIEVPMQGPFTNYAVGGHQSRHIKLNTGSDDYTNRPEAWKILLGQCAGTTSTSGAIGMAGADYPWPEANEESVRPYPLTGAQKAVYYRDFIAKSPLNIKNLKIVTGSTPLGNYTSNYEILHSVGAFANPRNFIENQPTLPTELTRSTQGRSMLSLHRTDEEHFQFVSDYSVSYLTSAAGKSIITGRFAAPGGMEVMSRGYLDIRGSEFSVYNSLLNRNLSVIKPSQGPSGTFSEATGAGGPGIRVSDIHHKDFGMRAHLARHSAQFGRDSLNVTASDNLPGKVYDQLPAAYKINRNTKNRLTQIENYGTVTTGALYDNWFVQYQIPRSDRQYSWFTTSLADPNSDRYLSFAPVHGALAGYYSSSAGIVSYFDFVSASSVSSSTLPTLFQPTTRVAVFTLDPLSASTNNILGFPTASSPNSYFNSVFIEGTDAAVSVAITGSAANFFNLLMTSRGTTYGWNWKKTHLQSNPVTMGERRANEITVADENDVLSRYRLHPLSLRGRPALINFDAPTSPLSARDRNSSRPNTVTIKATNNNELIYFGSVDLADYVLPTIDITTTPFYQLIGASRTQGYNLNWIAYTEALFPSARNEFMSYSTERIDYDNKFWRDSLDNRVTLGSAEPNSFNITIMLSQSSWPLDAQEDFETRTGPVTGSAPSEFAFSVQGKAGELQNNYFSFFTGTLSSSGTPGEGIDYRAPRMLRMGALYSHKHMIAPRRSARAPTGPTAIDTYGPGTFTETLQLYSGEAKWEANTQAGILIKSGATTVFESHPSEPWFNEYEDFRYDVKLMAKGYSIVPEFRISEHVEDYLKYGVNACRDKIDTFTIPGTIHTSATASFYKDFSNSEFMQDFLKVKNDSLLTAKEIRLICSAAIRFNPYKGFYPAQRTLDLVSQFSRSYAENLIGNALSTPGSTATANYGFPKLVQPQQAAGALRPLFQTLFAPGILYNTIKSGLAVDYPIVADDTKVDRSLNYYGAGKGPNTNNWAVTSTASGSSGITGYDGGEFWDRRIPFEAIVEPEQYLNGISVFDIEPHPSMSLYVTSAWGATSGDPIYSMMANNFFGEVAYFFLKDQEFTRLESNTLTDDIRFASGAIYGARAKLRRSVSGSRSYEYESGSAGNNDPYGRFGGLLATAGGLQVGSYPIPQDPRQNPNFKESFTMYSRPSAFGPAVGGRPTGSASKYASVINSAPIDSFTGFNWAYTPPYTNGEAWVDLIFKPSHTKSYDLDQILAEITPVYWRVDPGYNGINGLPYADYQTPLISSYVQYSGNLQSIYAGRNVNANAMQMSAAIDLFGVERVMEEETDKFGNEIKSTNKIAGKKWVIQPKFETPMMNFSDVGIHALTASDGTLTLPTYGSGATPQGMWHQFGIIETDPKKGIFLEIDDIPTEWLKFHYDVVNNSTAYNGNDINAGPKIFSRMKSLVDVAGFDKRRNRARLGELTEQTILREAIVAVPYIIESIDNKTLRKGVSKNITKTRKSFISIPTERYESALASEKGSLRGDSLDAAGESIRKLIQRMEQYVLPPHLDFLNNENIDPMVMYIFEFEYKLDQDDLSYIWQNIAPRDYKKITLTTQSIAHDLSINELLSEDDIMDNENLRWMVFKAHQRATVTYDDLRADQVNQAVSKDRGNSSGLRGANRGASSNDRSGRRGNRSESARVYESGYPIGFNWPYDFISFVEMIKLDAEVLYDEGDGSRFSGQREGADEQLWVTAPGMTVSTATGDTLMSSGKSIGGTLSEQGMKERANKLLGGD